jgi:Predicted 3'-5' exonuclease related to the exonuclease domain of PolB
VPSAPAERNHALVEPKGFDGGDVERHFHEGKIKEVADYCEADVVNTNQVWLRYELFRGRLSENAFEASKQNLADLRPAFEPAKMPANRGLFVRDQKTPILRPEHYIRTLAVRISLCIADRDSLTAGG